jgi:hypothetical protein
MITQSRSARSRTVTRAPGEVDKRPVGSDLAGRMIQIALALYLLPVLVIVVAVSCLGMLVLLVSRLVTGLIHKSAGYSK